MSAYNSTICFSCIICFEPFNCHDRYPVVLPCGHTYVCIECGNRLDKCYECRASLFYPEEENEKSHCPIIPNNHYSDRRIARNPQGYRSSYSERPRTFSYTASSYRRRVRPQASHNTETATNTCCKEQSIKPKKRIPLPKNLVLMSLIEVKDKASDIEKESTTLLCKMALKGVDENKNEELNVMLGTFFESVTCGTYVVKCRKGLKVFLRKPKFPIKNTNDNSCLSSQQDSEYLLDENNTTNNRILGSFSIPWNSKSKKRLTKLNFGDNVQVISIEDGWAMLARRKGFVSTENTQLVKVSGPTDKACRIEGILYAMFSDWKKIENDRTRVQRVKKQLIRELKLALTSEDKTVVPALPSVMELRHDHESITSGEQRKEAAATADVQTNQNSKDMRVHQNILGLNSDTLRKLTPLQTVSSNPREMILINSPSDMIVRNKSSFSQFCSIELCLS